MMQKVLRLIDKANEEVATLKIVRDQHEPNSPLYEYIDGRIYQLLRDLNDLWTLV